jgi:hypothetical protein
MLILAFVIGASIGGATYTYNKYRKHSKTNMAAISYSEFKQILSASNLMEKYENGEILCSISGQKVTYNNLGYIDARSDGQLVFVTKDSLPIAAQTARSELKAVFA